MSGERLLHCWTGYRETLELGSDAWIASYETGNATCLLQLGHVPPHEWTPDPEIGIQFVEPGGPQG